MGSKSQEKETNNMVELLEVEEETIAIIITITITIIRIREAFNMLLQERAHISISKELEIKAQILEVLVLQIRIANSMDPPEGLVPFIQDQVQLELVKVQVQLVTHLLRDNRIGRKKRRLF
jgi:hypothetical protein